MKDRLMHFADFSLPFGGVGASGVGKYRGDRFLQDTLRTSDRF